MSLPVLETLANLGLLFFLFLMGVELDLHSLRRTGMKALAIVAAGVDDPSFLVFMGVALSITAFPILARILTELKLLTTDVGRMALSATACKILGIVGVSSACKSVTIGFVMNTKGLMELIVLNIGKDRNVLNDQTFAIMVLMALFTTFITTPIIMAIYKPARRNSGIYQHRTILRKDKSSEVRLLACFNNTGNIPTIINLIEASRGGMSLHFETSGGGQLDDELLVEFRKKSSKDDMVNFEERVVRCKYELVNVIQSFRMCSLFLVARIPKGMGATVLTEMWME
ncbi:hypothetical protein H6P81_007717 [Aristolochia fimbriata]|uniref:Cation/H+ exchanger transmembrane domain-containing protein n=1 Tax=Aristolochia fimbriata TaxID=158543 RepID=A0AAV7F1C5_ARIFI|nr:hypothetical protein H6P81_007717 [Aristolochia fimbriata]